MLRSERSLAKLSWGGDGEEAVEIGVGFEERLEEGKNHAGGLVAQAEKHDSAGRCFPLMKHKFSKIAVKGENDPAVVVGGTQEFGVRRTDASLGSMKNVVSLPAKPRDGSGGEVFVLRGNSRSRGGLSGR